MGGSRLHTARLKLRVDEEGNNCTKERIEDSTVDRYPYCPKDCSKTE